MGHVYNCLFSLLDKDCSNIVNFGFVSAFFLLSTLFKRRHYIKSFMFPYYLWQDLDCHVDIAMCHTILFAFKSSFGTMILRTGVLANGCLFVFQNLTFWSNGMQPPCHHAIWLLGILS